MKKFFAIFIVFVLMMSIMPAAAFADDADTTPPEWQTDYPNAGRICDALFSLKVKSNENGNVYFVRLPDGASPPTAQQVKEGKSGSGDQLAYPFASSVSVNADLEYAVFVRGLKPNTAYDIYTVLEDSAGNLQPAASLLEVTTTVPDAAKTVINQTMMGQGTKQVQLNITVKNADGYESPGYSASDFSVKVDGSAKTFAEAPFSGFYDPGNGTYTVYFTGDEHNKTYQFTELSVYGYIIKSDTVMVTTPPAIPNVCAIDAVEYATLDEALAAVGEGETKTIRLLTNITYNNGIVIDGRTVIFDLDGHTLDVSNPGGTGLEVQNGGQVSHTGTGYFNVSGAECGVEVTGINSSAAVNNVTAAGRNVKGVYARSGGHVTVDGDIVVSAADVDDFNQSGAVAEDEGTEIVVNGSISVDGNYIFGVFASGSSNIAVNTQNGHSVTVAGSNAYAVTIYNASVTLSSSISVTSEAEAYGAVVSSSGELTAGGITISAENVTGDVWGESWSTILEKPRSMEALKWMVKAAAVSMAA